MYDCQTLLKLLYPYLDNELDVKESIRVQMHLEECPSCRTIFEKEQVFLAWLREKVPAAPAPTPLQQKVISRVRGRKRPPSRLSRWIPARLQGGLGAAEGAKRMTAAAALILLVGGFSALWFSHLQKEKRMQWVEAAVEAHDAVAARKAALQTEASDPEVLSRWFQGKADIPFSIPNDQVGPIQILGGRVETVSTVRAPFIVFKAGGETVSLLLAPPQSMAIGAEAGKEGRLTFYTTRRHGYEVLAWSDSNVSYLLVSKKMESAKEGCLLCHGGEKGNAPARRLL